MNKSIKQKKLPGHCSTSYNQLGHAFSSSGPLVEPGKHLRVLKQYPQFSCDKQSSHFATSSLCINSINMVRKWRFRAIYSDSQKFICYFKFFLKYINHNFNKSIDIETYQSAIIMIGRKGRPPNIQLRYFCILFVLFFFSVKTDATGCNTYSAKDDGIYW